MAKTTKALRQEEIQSWKDKGAVLKFRQKKIRGLGENWIVELQYAEDRGGMINIWNEGETTLTHVWQASDDNKWHKSDEVHFMYWENALMEYRDIVTFSDTLNLMIRNS